MAVANTNNISTFAPLDQGDLLISTENVTSTVWLNNNPTLFAYYTDTTQINSATGQFYYNIYHNEETTGSIQFAVAYCDADGSGSLLYNPNVNGLSPTRTNYGQYRTLILGDETSAFVFGNKSSSFFYALPVQRSGYKEELLPGVMTLAISGSSTSTGKTLYLTDDSRLGGAAQYSEAGRVYNLVSGSAGTVFTGVNENGWSKQSGSYGWFLPDIGTILLNGEALSQSVSDGGICHASVNGFQINRASNAEVNNPAKLITALNTGGNVASQGGVVTTNPGWTLNNQEQLSSDYIFCRARSQNFNYSTNPSFISGSDGAVLYDNFINDPQVYITTVGLYNNDQELVAVAKLSRPLLKDFTKELLVRIKLDF